MFPTVIITTIILSILSLILANTVPLNISRTAGLPLIVILSVAGVWLLVANVTRIESALAQKQWPVIDGIVIRSSLSESKWYKPVIEYRYTVNETVYNQVSNLKVPSFGASSTRKDVAFKTIAIYQQDQIVSVYYNPSDPSESYLKPGPTWDEFTRMALGITLYGFGIYGAICYWFNRDKSGRV